MAKRPTRSSVPRTGQIAGATPARYATLSPMRSATRNHAPLPAVAIALEATRLAAELDDALDGWLMAAEYVTEAGASRRLVLERHIRGMTHSERLRLAGALHLLSLNCPHDQ